MSAGVGGDSASAPPAESSLSVYLNGELRYSRAFATGEPLLRSERGESMQAWPMRLEQEEGVPMEMLEKGVEGASDRWGLETSQSTCLAETCSTVHSCQARCKFQVFM